MFEQQNVIRLFSILSYLGFIISAITGLIELNTEFTLCMLMTSCVVIISAIPIAILDIKNQFICTDKQIYYIRSAILLHYALLSLGLTEVGIGFGIFGIIMFVINIISGVFETETQYTISKNDMESPTTTQSTTHASHTPSPSQNPFNQPLEETY
jgi:hypothetical protein